MGPGALAQVLRPLTQRTDPNVLVGLQTSDDAAVYRLSDDLAMIQTVDFFPPVVDDPYLYGSIAAANSMSDVYAMGGDVLMALNIAAFPDSLPTEIITRIFEGGADKAAEAGIVIAGGHTVVDDEPKYGLVVTGTIHPERILTKAGAQAGDYLYLTKPLGTGVITTALKAEAAEAKHIDAAIASMTKLNRAASGLIREIGANSCTDITGFGLIGHSAEVAEKSGVKVVLYAQMLPFLEGAERYAAEGRLPGGAGRNRDFYSNRPTVPLEIGQDVSAVTVDLLFDPETSGGLLFSIPPERAEQVEADFAAANEPLWQVGHIDEGRGLELTAK